MSIDKLHLQTALAETAKDHGPGVFGLVTQDGRVSFAGTAGVADLDRPRPIASTDRFRIGSITKVYVATLVLQLVADGALRLDDTVDDRLPGLVPEGGAITVENAATTAIRSTRLQRGTGGRPAHRPVGP